MRPLHLRLAGMVTACGRDVYRLVSSRATGSRDAVTCVKCLERMEG